MLDEEIELPNLVATLVPEPNNPYDANAIMVLIDGHHVGYLEKEDARVYQPIIQDVWDRGFVAETGARVWASARESWDSRELKYVARVTLALNQPHLLVPLNDPPVESYSLLPWGAGLQVTGEEAHQDVLADFITPAGDAIAIGTLTIIQAGTTRAPKEVVEVRLGGRRVGQLTAGSSQHFIPTIRHLEENGMSAVVWARVKGSAIAAQVILQAAKAHELAPEWLAVPVTLPRLHR